MIILRLENYFLIFKSKDFGDQKRPHWVGSIQMDHLKITKYVHSENLSQIFMLEFLGFEINSFDKALLTRIIP